MLRALLLVVVTGCRLHFDVVGVADAEVVGDVANDVAVRPTSKVTIEIAGSGGIADPGNHIACDATCTTEVPQGVTLHLTAAASPGSWFRGWTGAYAGRHDCDLVVADQPILLTADFVPEPNRIFISSMPHDGNFGSLAAGDQLCTMIANQAGLTGSYAILISTSTVKYDTRLAGARGWIRPDGEPVGDADPSFQNVRAAIRITETGAEIGSASLWAPASSGCNEWATFAATASATAIDAARGANYQSGGAQTSCATLQHFLCAENDRQQPVSPVPERGRHAFTSVSKWADKTGIAAADATCAADATAAGLPGTYLALLPPATGASALSRFDLTGAPWVRADGEALLPTAKAWLTAQNLTAALTFGPVSEQFTDFPILLGADHPGDVGTDALDCTNWTGAGVTSANAYSWDTAITGSGRFACDGTWNVLCLEE